MSYFSLHKGLCFFALLFLTSLTTSAGTSFAEDSSLNFVTLRHPPYGFLSADDEKQGYLYEIANAVMKEADVKGQNDILPTLRVFNELEDGAAHCSILARMPLPEARYDKLASIGKEIKIVVIPRKAIVINSYDDLAGVKIGVPRGVFVGEPFDVDETLIKIPTKGYDLSSIMFKNRRVDAIVGAYDSLMFNLDKIGVPRKDIGDAYTFFSVPLWVMCQPGKITEDQRERLISATKKLRKNGTIERIIGRYLPKDISS